MGLVVNNFETQQGFVLPSGYYKITNINWDLISSQVYCVLSLYASQEAYAQGKTYFPTETISYDFTVDNEQISDLEGACYDYVLNAIGRYDTIEAAIAAYEADEQNYSIEYDEESGEEIGRTLIPNDELYSQRFVLPFNFDKLRNAIKI